MTPAEKLLSVLNRDNATSADVLAVVPGSLVLNVRPFIPLLLAVRSDPPHDYLPEVPDTDDLTQTDLITLLDFDYLHHIHKITHSTDLSRAIMEISGYDADLLRNRDHFRHSVLPVLDWLNTPAV